MTSIFLHWLFVVASSVTFLAMLAVTTMSPRPVCLASQTLGCGRLLIAIGAVIGMARALQTGGTPAPDSVAVMVGAAIVYSLQLRVDIARWRRREAIDKGVTPP